MSSYAQSIFIYGFYNYQAPRRFSIFSVSVSGAYSGFSKFGFKFEAGFLARSEFRGANDP